MERGDSEIVKSLTEMNVQMCERGKSSAGMKFVLRERLRCQGRVAT